MAPRCLVVLIAVVLAGCSFEDTAARRTTTLPPSSPGSSSRSIEPVVTPVPGPPPTISTAEPINGDLAASFDSLVANLPAGEIGVATYSAGRTAVYGSRSGGAAWSTVKVPLSIAALRMQPSAAQPLMQRAISQSDNAAAEQLWNLLGDPSKAAEAVEVILKEGGDAGVTVQSEQIRPPYSPYGQTLWPNNEAARFAFQLPCVAGAAPVVQQMRDLSGNQQWGLAPYAGGWGPESDGGYLVRQIALVTNSSGTFGVSMEARPADGSFSTGTAMLDSVGAWADQHRDDIAGGYC